MKASEKSSGTRVGMWIALALVLHGAILLSPAPSWAAEARPEVHLGWALVIHGGAGTILPDKMDAGTEAAYRKKLLEAVHTGAAVLEAGGSSLDAVEATIRLMEDSSLFNAGKGAVFTAAGKNEMDASIMDGRDLDAGAVAGVKTVKHPISAARAVMARSPHVMLAGDGADAFARAQGLEIVPPKYFWTQRRWDDFQLRKKEMEKEKEEEARKESESGERQEGSSGEKKGNDSTPGDGHLGTVGCVALDRDGNIAAGTSTGGMTMKMWGRIGDSPIIGAGTYADNHTCGVSCTGHGEFFIRNAVAYDITALMKYKNLSLEKAAQRVVNHELKDQHAAGGMVALDKQGNISMVFNTAGMYRGFAKEDGTEAVFLFRGEDGDGAAE